MVSAFRFRVSDENSVCRLVKNVSDARRAKIDPSASAQDGLGGGGGRWYVGVRRSKRNEVGGRFRPA